MLSYLPAAHIADRFGSHYQAIAFGHTITCCPNPREVVGYLPAVKPTWFFAVPRIWEKLKAGMEGFLMSARPPDDADRNRAWLEAASQKVELEQAGEDVPADLAATVEEADRELFAGLRAMLGLDEAASVNVGAAPTPRRRAGVLPRHRHPARRALGDVRDLRRGLLQPDRPGEDRQRRAGRAGRGAEARERR